MSYYDYRGGTPWDDVPDIGEAVCDRCNVIIDGDPSHEWPDAWEKWHYLCRECFEAEEREEVM